MSSPPLESIPPEPRPSAEVGNIGYMNAMGEVDLLSDYDEYRLGTLIQEGRRALADLGGSSFDEAASAQIHEVLVAGKAAHNEMVLANLRLVPAIAQRYSAVTGAPFDDLVQEGNLILRDAAYNFDPTRNLRFSTLAVDSINKGLRRAVTRNRTPAEHDLFEHIDTVAGSSPRMLSTEQEALDRVLVVELLDKHIR